MIPSHYDHMEKTFETLRDIKHERLDKKETKTERRNGKQSKWHRRFEVSTVVETYKGDKDNVRWQEKNLKD